MGLREKFDWDGGVGEPYWGPSAKALCYVTVLGKNFEDPSGSLKILTRIFKDLD